VITRLTIDLPGEKELVVRGGYRGKKPMPPWYSLGWALNYREGHQACLPCRNEASNALQ
jgi:hypothetical protein